MIQAIRNYNWLYTAGIYQGVYMKKIWIIPIVSLGMAILAAAGCGSIKNPNLHPGHRTYRVFHPGLS